MLPSLSRFNILGHVFGLLGRVRFRISANPFLESGRFLQTLRLRDATVEFRLGEGEDMVSARVWVDAHHPVIHVLVEGGRPLEVNASVETWWDCRNPMPEIAGLLAVTERLLALAGDKVEAGEKALWERLHMKMPDIPIQEVEGRKMLAPAEKFATKTNIENPELRLASLFHSLSRSSRQLRCCPVAISWGKEYIDIMKAGVSLSAVPRRAALPGGVE